MPTIGSAVSCGRAPWPPPPISAISKLSAEAASGPACATIWHGEAPVHVRAEDRGDPVERPRLEHAEGAPTGLLRGLEHDQHVARGGPRGQEIRRAHGPRGVHVVAAGVHHAGIARRERETGVLGDRKRVDVPAHRHGGEP